MKERDGIKYFTSPVLEKFPGAAHAFLGRAGGVSPPPYGSLNFDATRGDDPVNVSRNRELLEKGFNMAPGKLITLTQVHGDRAVIVDGASVKNAAGTEGDMIVTALPGTSIGILTADCFPVLLYDPSAGVISAVHAGWKGALLDVCGKALGEMARVFGSRPGDVAAALGPGIGPCCYGVGEEVVSEFEKRYGRENSFHQREGRHYLDIREVLKSRLLDAGVLEGNIDAIGLCTSCRTDLFFSYRKEAGKTGRQLSFITLADGKEKVRKKVGKA